MIDARPGLTYAEIARKYDRAASTVARVWSQHPQWPNPIGKRGRSNEYDPQAVDAVVCAHFLREPTNNIDPGRLYTASEAADACGLAFSTVRADITRRRWREPDEVRDGIPMWRGSTLQDLMAKRQRRTSS